MKMKAILIFKHELYDQAQIKKPMSKFKDSGKN